MAESASDAKRREILALTRDLQGAENGNGSGNGRGHGNGGASTETADALAASVAAARLAHQRGNDSETASTGASSTTSSTATGLHPSPAPAVRSMRQAPSLPELRLDAAGLVIGSRNDSDEEEEEEEEDNPRGMSSEQHRQAMEQEAGMMEQDESEPQGRFMREVKNPLQRRRASLGPRFTRVEFTVRARTRHGQTVHIVGAPDELGCWDPLKSVAMQSSKDRKYVWKARVDLVEATQIDYKYIVRSGKRLDRYETMTANRRLFPVGIEGTVDDGEFGIDADGAKWSASGFLAGASKLSILLGGVTGRHHCGTANSTCRKCDPTAVENVHRPGFVWLFPSYESEGPVTRVMISAMRPFPGDRPYDVKLPLQDPLASYHFTSTNLERLVVNFTFYNGERVIGKGILTFSQFARLRGGESAPILQPETMIPIGEFFFEYVVTKPFVHPKMSNALGRSYWKSTKTVDIGHRGAGGNQQHKKSSSMVGENTILSFVTAAQLGAEYIEFDVQLTKDHVPVIFHDSLIPVKIGNPPYLKTIPISQLTVAEFFRLAPKRPESKHRPLNRRSSMDDIFYRTDGHTIGLRRTSSVADVTEAGALEASMEHRNVFDYDENHDDPEQDPLVSVQTRKEVESSLSDWDRRWFVQDSFATLAEVFDKVPISAGFDIELKYLNHLEQRRSFSYERNFLIDHVLKVVFDRDDGRRIFFSSFDPDICLMLSLKQPRYPVFFLTEGGLKRNKLDPRKRSLDAAIHFAKSTGLLGIVSRATLLLENHELIHKVKANGLMLMTYGPENDDIENVKVQEELGVDAICEDHLSSVSVFKRSKETTTPSLFRELLNDAVRQGASGATTPRSGTGLIVETPSEVAGVPRSPRPNGIETRGHSPLAPLRASNASTDKPQASHSSPRGADTLAATSPTSKRIRFAQ